VPVPAAGDQDGAAVVQCGGGHDREAGGARRGRQPFADRGAGP
jgi:hypothetical protein